MIQLYVTMPLVTVQVIVMANDMLRIAYNIAVFSNHMIKYPAKTHPTGSHLSAMSNIHNKVFSYTITLYHMQLLDCS